MLIAGNSCDASDSCLSAILSEPSMEQDVSVKNMNTEPIKMSFHLGITKYLIFHGPNGFVENIHLQEWENGKAAN